MVHPDELSTPSFAPSPPPSASANTSSDCDSDLYLDLDRRQGVKEGGSALVASVRAGVGRRLPGRQHHKKRKSSSLSPSSIPTSAFSIPSAESSFADSDAKPNTHHDTHLDTVLALIKASKDGSLPANLPCPEWHVLEIAPAQYAELRDLLDRRNLLAYFEQLRYDYHPDRSRLVLRLMASSLHECLKEKLCFEIQIWLHELAARSDPPLADLASKIDSVGHSKVILEAESGALGKKSPDGQLSYDGTRPPQLVIEIGYSQKAESLEELAREYYEGSDGQVKTVLTINVNYSTPDIRQTGTRAVSRMERMQNRSAVFSLYRGPKRIHHNQAFRDAQGNHVPDGSLRFLLSDFIPDTVLRQLDPTLRRQANSSALDVSAQQLSKLLEKAEYIQAKEDNEAQVMQPPQQASNPSKKRKSVQWDRTVREDEGEGDDGDDGDDGDGSSEGGQSSKRRRSAGKSIEERTYRSSRSRRTSGSIDLPARRRTRSMSRSDSASQA